MKIQKLTEITATRFLHAAHILRRLHHQHVLKLYAVCTTEEPIYIITEFTKHGSLLDHLRHQGQSLGISELIGMSAQVASGMAYLEKNSYIHRNLWARSVLVGEGNECKISGFEDAHLTKEEIYEDDKAEVVTMWTAPEALFYHEFSIKSDVWSFGIVLYEMITRGRFPYTGMDSKQVKEALKQGYRMPRPNGCPDKLYDIMQKCWEPAPSARPTFETLKWLLKDFFVADVEPDHKYEEVH